MRGERCKWRREVVVEVDVEVRERREEGRKSGEKREVVGG